MWTQLVALGISMLALGVAVAVLFVGGRDVSDFERGRIEGRREVIAEMNGHVRRNVTKSL